MLKFVLVAGLVGTWAAPVKDALVPRQDGSSIEDDILGLSNLDEDSNLWSAFYCEGANYVGQCITQQYSNGECTSIEPPLCENVLSFLATSSNCVLYEGDDCSGSAIPIYSSAQDLHAFRKTNSYRCGLSSAQVAAQLATPPTTPAAHSPAPVTRVSLISTETTTVAFAQSVKETSIIDAHRSLHATTVTPTVEVVAPASESSTSRTDDTPSTATARAAASSVSISSSSSTDPHRHHQRPKYVTVTETATRVVDAYVALTETSAPSLVTNKPSHAETREAAPSPIRTTNTGVAATETATRTLDAYVTPSATLSEQTLDKVLTTPETLTTSTLVDAQPLPLVSSNVGLSTLEASETSQALAKSGLSTAPSPTSLTPSVHDIVDATVPTASLSNTSPSSPSASVISHTESISHPTVSSESTSETPSSTNDSVTHASTGLSSSPEGTEVVSGHQIKPLVGQPKGGSAITGVSEPTQLHDAVPSETSPVIPSPIPSASTTFIADKQAAALPSVEPASTAVPLAGTPTASVSAKPVSHIETINNVTPSSLLTSTPEATERPPSSRAPYNHADALAHSNVTYETSLTSAAFSPTSILVDDHVSSIVTAHATTPIETLVSALSSNDNVAPSAPTSTSITPASTKAPIIPPAVNTGASTLRTFAADVKTTIARQIATPTVISVSTASTRNNEGLGGSQEDGPSHLSVDSSATDTEVPPISSSDVLPKESASIITSVHPALTTAFSSSLQGPVDSSTVIENLPPVSSPGSSGILPKEPVSVIGSVYVAPTTPFSSSLKAPLPTSSPTQFSHVAEEASHTYRDTASNVLATPSSLSTQAPERDSATVTTHGVMDPGTPPFTLSGLPSTSTVSHASPATGASAVAAQIPSPHTPSTHLSDPAAATPPPRSSTDELPATVVHLASSLGTASTHVPKSISAGSTPETSLSVKGEGASSVTVGVSSTSSAPPSIGSSAVIEATHVTYDAPSAASSLSSIPSAASQTDYDGVAHATIDQNIGGYSTPAAQPASVVSPSALTASETHVPNAPSSTEELASSPASARTTQPEGETVNVTISHTTLLGPIATSTAARQAPSVLSTAKVLPIVNPFKSGSTLANDGGRSTSTLPLDKGSIATAYPTPTSNDRVAFRPPSLISPLPEVYTSNKGPSYATIRKHTSFGSAETPPGSIQATPAPVLHLTSHEGHAIDDKATAYATVTSSTLITPNSAAQTTIPELSPEALATWKSRLVSNGGADLTSVPMSPDETAVHRTTSITASPTPSAPRTLGAPSSRVPEGSIQLNPATDAAPSTTLLSPVVTPISLSISTSTPTAGSTSSEIFVTPHPTSSQVLFGGDHGSSTVYGGTSSLPTSVHEPALTTTSRTETDLPPVNPATPTSSPRSHAVNNDSGLVHVTVHPAAGSVSTTTAVSIVSPKVEESGKAGVTSVPSSIASSAASGAPGEGPAYVTSRTTDSASDTPTGVIPEVSNVSLPSSTVLAISTQSTLQDGTAYATIQQSVTVGATPTTTFGTLASVSSPSHVVDDESLVYVTIHSTRTLGAPLAPLFTSVASVSSGVEPPTITPLLASNSVSPTPNPEKESLAYIIPHHTLVTTHPSSAVVSHTVDEGVYAAAEPTTTTGLSSTASVTVIPSIGTTTAVEVEGPVHVTVQRPSAGSTTIVAENTGDANVIPVIPPTSTPRTSALPYVSAGTVSGASATVTEPIESVKLATTSVGTTPAASATSTVHILSTKKERFTTIRYAGIRTSTPTTSAPYGSTSIATTVAPAEPTGTTAVNTISTPYALASATVTGTIEQVESTASNPAASSETTAAENVTSSTEPATNDRTLVSSELRGGASTFTSTIIVIPPSRSTGTKTIVTDTTGDSDDIPVLPAASMPSISTTPTSFPGSGTGVSTMGHVEMTGSVALKLAASVGATPTQESSGIVGPTNGYHAIATTSAASFGSSGLPGSSSAYTSTYAAAPITESTGNKTIAVESAGDSDDIILPHLTTPISSHTASTAESPTTTTSIAQNVDDSNDVPVLPYTSSLTVSPLSLPVHVVPVSYTSSVETASPYASVPTTDAPLITKIASLVAHPASSATNPASSPGINSVTTTASLAAAGVESESSAVSSVSEITSKPSSSPVATSTKENQDAPVVTTPTSSSLVTVSVEVIRSISSTSESAPATSSVLATAATAPPLSAATASVPSPPETVFIPNSPSAAFSTKSSAVASPSYSQGTLESASAPSSSPVAASTVETQIPISAGARPSSLQATYTSASTLLPVTTTVASQSASSLLQTASAPNSSPTFATVEHLDPVETVSALSVSASSVLASATPISPPSAASVAVPSIPISSPAAATTEGTLYASSAVASPSYSQPLASSATAGAINPISSASGAVSTTSSSHIPAAVKDTQSPPVTETATSSVQPTPLVAGSTEPTSSPAAATGKEFQTTFSVLETASFPTSSVVPTVIEGKQSAPLGSASPAPSAPFTYSAEGLRPTSSVPEAAAAPRSSPSVVTIKDPQSPSPVEVTSYVTHTPTPTSSSVDATKDSQIGSPPLETASTPVSSSVVTSVSHRSVHPASVEATPTQSTSSGLVTAISSAATLISSFPETTSSPTSAPSAAIFKDRLASPISTHASAPTEGIVKDTSSPLATGAQPALAVLTTTPTPSVTTRLGATPAPTHTHYHNHHDNEEEEIVYVTIVTTTTVTEPVCTTTTYPTETVTQTVVARPGLEVVQPTGLSNGQ